MSVRVSAYATRLLKATFIILLLGVLAVSATAGAVWKTDDSRKDNSSDRGNGRAYGQQAPAAQGTDQRGNSEYRRGSDRDTRSDSRETRTDTSRTDSGREARPDTARTDRSDTARPETRDNRWNNTSRDSGRDESTRTDRTGNQDRPRDNGSQQNKDRWNSDGSRDTGAQSNTDRWNGDRSRTDKRPDYNRDQTRQNDTRQWDNYRNERDNRDSDRVYSTDRTRDRVPQTGRYTPPTYRGGYYYYSDRPTSRRHYGFWSFGFDTTIAHRSVYFHFGYFPYIRSTRIFVETYPTVYYNSSYYMNNGYYLYRNRNRPLDDTLTDIRYAWEDGRFDLIKKHIDRNRKIAVLLDGRYDYSVRGEDYLDMTADVMDEIHTVDFNWQSVRERRDGLFTAFGNHTYRDATGRTRTVYVSYTLKKDGKTYEITEVGSSQYLLR